jgi:hypothetical protein
LKKEKKELLHALTTYFGGLLSRPFPDGLPVVLGLPPLPLAMRFTFNNS